MRFFHPNDVSFPLCSSKGFRIFHSLQWRITNATDGRRTFVYTVAVTVSTGIGFLGKDIIGCMHPFVGTECRSVFVVWPFFARITHHLRVQKFNDIFFYGFYRNFNRFFLDFTFICCSCCCNRQHCSCCCAKKICQKLQNEKLAKINPFDDWCNIRSTERWWKV